LTISSRVAVAWTPTGVPLTRSFRCCRRDLAERHRADEAARRVGEIDRAELLLLERAHLPKRIVDRGIRGECGDARVHKGAGCIEGICEELADLGSELPRKTAEHGLALAGVKARHDRGGA